MIRLFWQASDRALRIARSLESIPALLARFVVGVVFVTSGWGKVHNLEKVTAFFTELHIPAPALQAVFVSYVELVCGSLLLVGLASRLSAIPLIVSMIVALITAKAARESAQKHLAIHCGALRSCALSYLGVGRRRFSYGVAS